MWYKCEHNLRLCDQLPFLGGKWRWLSDSNRVIPCQQLHFMAQIFGSCAMKLILPVLRGRNTDFMWGGLRTKRCTCTHVIKTASGSGATDWSRLAKYRLRIFLIFLVSVFMLLYIDLTSARSGLCTFLWTIITILQAPRPMVPGWPWSAGLDIFGFSNDPGKYLLIDQPRPWS